MSNRKSQPCPYRLMLAFPVGSKLGQKPWEGEAGKCKNFGGLGLLFPAFPWAVFFSRTWIRLVYVVTNPP